MKEFRIWATHAKLKKSITVYEYKSYNLRFSKSGNPNIETAYRTHFLLVTYNKNNNQKNNLATPNIDDVHKTRRAEK